MHKLSRRSVLRHAAAASLVLSAPGIARSAHISSKLRVASVGTGGKGKDDLQQVAASDRVDVVAICNIDQSKDHFGLGGRSVSGRKALHRLASIARCCRHIRCSDRLNTGPHARPRCSSSDGFEETRLLPEALTHTVLEARQMTQAAQQNHVITQMEIRFSLIRSIVMQFRWCMMERLAKCVKSAHGRAAQWAGC